MLFRWRTTVASAAAVVMAALPVGVRSAAHAAPPECPSLDVIAIPGTWETSDKDPGKGMLGSITNNLPGNVRTDYVAYAATAFPWEGDVYGRSKQEAVDHARGIIGAMAQRCGATRFALLGYSQGADAAGDVASSIGTGLGVVPANRVALVGLIADPRRSPTDQLIGPPVAGAGASGPRVGGFGWVGPRTYTFCAIGDLYCSMPNGDFAGRIGGLLVQLSNPDPAKLGIYQQEVGTLVNDALAAGGVGLLDNQITSQEYNQRKKQVDDFLKSGIHQSYPRYAVDPGGNTALTWLHQRLIDEAHG
ncbi:cutinase family protein [Nocardia sp. NEAU-G5]|uniref:Cutinase family protein n=1 Tax=Nocardia albiluteola TaxID=2842303 RepID=A0ABS6AYX1_9NOCA|nr:cutinase family protein [Nocardia albiluteola]MBU3062204.1 cutinase family protein [Nocardia albiluteola]